MNGTGDIILNKHTRMISHYSSVICWVEPLKSTLVLGIPNKTTPFQKLIKPIKKRFEKDISSMYIGSSGDLIEDYTEPIL